MAKIIPLVAFTYAGKEYQPDEKQTPIEVSDETAALLVKKSLAQMADGAAASDDEPSGELEELREQVETLTIERDELTAKLEQRTFPGELTDLVGIKAAFNLINANFDSVAKLKAAEDKALTDLPEVGVATLKKLRDALAD